MYVLYISDCHPFSFQLCNSLTVKPRDYVTAKTEVIRVRMWSVIVQYIVCLCVCHCWLPSYRTLHWKGVVIPWNPRCPNTFPLNINRNCSNIFLVQGGWDRTLTVHYLLSTLTSITLFLFLILKIYLYKLILIWSSIHVIILPWF